jgi:hypothetical protein
LTPDSSPRPTSKGASIKEEIDRESPRSPMVPRVAINEKVTGAIESRRSCQSRKKRKRRTRVAAMTIRRIPRKDLFSSLPCDWKNEMSQKNPFLGPSEDRGTVVRS